MSLANGLLLIKHVALRHEHITKSEKNDNKMSLYKKMMSLYRMSISLVYIKSDKKCRSTNVALENKMSLRMSLGNLSL